MRKPKIICPLGPSTDDPKILEAMMDSGMDVARFNFSHGTHAEHKVRLELLKKLRKEKNLPVAALLDTKGPEIRLKPFAEGKVTLETGQKFPLTAREVTGTKDICSVSYKNLAQDVHPGSQIMLDDGLISMKVLERTETDITCLVQNGGPIKDRKGVNVPGVHLSMPYMSAQDREDLLFGIQEGFDFVAASFCRSAQDVMEIRRLLDENHSDMRIIAKLENQEGVNNVDEILAVADGVMIASGDMGVELDFPEIPDIQKDIIAYNYFGRMRYMTPDIRLGICGATAHAACTTATDTNASAIITVTKSGATPRLISRFRPETPIVACVMDEPVQRQLSLTWGVKPIIMDYVQSTDEMIEGAVSAAQKAGLIHDGEIAVVTAGVPAGIAGTTNMIKVHLVGSSLINGAGVGDENVKGVLCVCRTLEDVRHKFHPGMILVVPHTNNEMLPYIRQAVGVITEENGLGSHAAVVGLSLNKAVIVGAIGATRTLHDGMKVSMDCRQGSVQSLAE